MLQKYDEVCNSSAKADSVTTQFYFIKHFFEVDLFLSFLFKKSPKGTWKTSRPLGNHY